jgi:3-oxoacyl-[acyl-carrier-protein] synthase-3
MSQVSISGVRIAGITCAVPKTVVGNDYFSSLYDASLVKSIEKMTGVKTRRFADSGVCASDLCFAAAEKLLETLAWERESIDAFIFLTQSPDCFAPGTACDLHRRLGLSTTCTVFDVTLSCSGYVHGLWLCSTIMSGSGFKRILFLNGDIGFNRMGERAISRSVAQLFGDAGAATAIERDAAAPTSNFILRTDGSGFKSLYVPAGGLRIYSTEATRTRTLREDGSYRSDEEMYMDGSEIFKFSLERVPEVLRELKEYAVLDFDQVDYFLFHQANKFILDHLRTFLKIKPEKMPSSIADFGNTSSASIPLTMVTRMSEQLTERSSKLVMVGFGSGYTWSAGYLNAAPMRCAELVEV